MKTFASPFSVNTPGVISARLYATLCGVEQSITLGVANGTGANAGKATLTLPAGQTPARGVWQLQLKTACGCYGMPVSSAACPPPSVSPDDGGGGDGDDSDPIPTCDDDTTQYCNQWACS